MLRFETQHVFAFPREAVWPVLSKTDWLNRAIGLPSVQYQIKPAPPGGSVVGASARTPGGVLRWRELPFEWIEPEFYRVQRLFQGGPFQEFNGGMTLEATRDGGTKAVIYSEWIARGALGRMLLKGFIGPKSQRDLRNVLAHAEEHLHGRTTVAMPNLPIQPVNDNALRAGLTKLTESGQPIELVQRLEYFLRKSPDVEMTHIRPFAMARIWGEDRWQVLSLFLQASRCGVVDFSWEVLCPNCRSTREPPATSLSQLRRTAHCEVCEIKFDAEFDKSVELKFSVNPAVRPANYQTFCLAGPGGKPHIVSQLRLQAESQRTWKWPAAHRPLRLQSPEVAASLTVWPKDLPAQPQRLTVVCEPERFVLGAETDPASTEAILGNPNPYPILVSWHQPEWSEDILTAARVTNWQEFRDLFSSEVISPNEQVTVGAQVVLFTDLRGSTALYHGMGDARAYALVRNHFGVLTAAIRAHHGAVVKTIGDAVMATFCRVDEALAAVQQSFERLPTANPDLAAPLTLKSSLHVGPCLAVNANDRLDYFGTTINLAARMVECCQGGDLTVSDELFQRPETTRFLENRPHPPEGAEMLYRGFETPHKVWRIRMV